MTDKEAVDALQDIKRSPGWQLLTSELGKTMEEIGREIIAFKITPFNGADLAFMQGQHRAIVKLLGIDGYPSPIDDLIGDLTPKEEPTEDE